MMTYLAAVPHVIGVSSTYETIIVALAVIAAVVWWRGCPKWLAVIVCILATAAILSTPTFGPWLQARLDDITSGFLGRN